MECDRLGAQEGLTGFGAGEQQQVVGQPDEPVGFLPGGSDGGGQRFAGAAGRAGR